MKPVIILVFPEPGKLLTGVFMGIKLNLPDGIFQAAFALEMSKQFLITNRV
jgi:hypothetical protein